jgi:hypothetical protein
MTFNPAEMRFSGMKQPQTEQHPAEKQPVSVLCFRAEAALEAVETGTRTQAIRQGTDTACRRTAGGQDSISSFRRQRLRNAEETVGRDWKGR